MRFGTDAAGLGVALRQDIKVDRSSRGQSTKTAGPVILLLLTVALSVLGLYFFNNHLSQSLTDEMPSVTVNHDPAEVELLLDESYWWLSQGETETALERLEELTAYCEMTGEQVPKEAEELYEQALEEWLLFSIESGDLEEDS